LKLGEVVEQFLIDCKIRGLSDETISWYRKRLGLFVRKLEQDFQVAELEDVKIIHLRQFVQLLMNSKSGANTRLILLSQESRRWARRGIGGKKSSRGLLKKKT
jgi:site-specific recombinase XerD